MCSFDFFFESMLLYNVFPLLLFQTKQKCKGRPQARSGADIATAFDEFDNKLRNFLLDESINEDRKANTPSPSTHITGITIPGIDKTGAIVGKYCVNYHKNNDVFANRLDRSCDRPMLWKLYTQSISFH